MIKVRNLVKNYGKKCALDNISFTVKEGEILGFLGPNGAGKSTTMNILTGYLSSTSGNVEIDGIDVMKKPIKTKEKIGYLPENPPLYQDMTVEDYLSFVFDLKKIKKDKQEHLEEICKIVGISDVCKRLIKNLSKGYKQRVGLAQALVGFPAVLILDEPTVGLDPKQIIEIRNLIKSFAQKHTVILSSHVLPEIQAICERVLVINNGKIVADDTPEKLSANITGNDKMRVVIDGDEDEVYELIKNIEGIVTVKKLENENEDSCSFDIEYLPGSDMRKTLAKAVNSTGAILLSAVNIQLSLEDIFLKLTEDNEEALEDEKEEDEMSLQAGDKNDEEAEIETSSYEGNQEEVCCDESDKKNEEKQQDEVTSDENDKKEDKCENEESNNEVSDIKDNDKEDTNKKDDEQHDENKNKNQGGKEE